MWLPLQKAISAVLFDRYNNDPQKRTAIGESTYHIGTNYGPPPPLFGEYLKIPRLWNMNLGAAASFHQFGFPESNSKLPLPPPPIYPPRRADVRSLSLSWNLGNPASADTLYVPSTFVGWNPNTGPSY